MDGKIDIKRILEQVQNGGITVDEAERYLRREPFEEMGFAKLDMHREVRTGFQEVVYCAGKPDSYLISIFKTLYKKNGEVLGQERPRRSMSLCGRHFHRFSMMRCQRY